MKNNPYIGPRPYERDDRQNFYGRAREARDLLSLILSERVVLFYAQSGAGKTSLLNTQIVPALENEGFHVLPIVRVGSDVPPGIPPATIKNIFAFSVWMGLTGNEAPSETLVGTTLVSLLSTKAAHDNDENPRPPILIIDQFEEIFTTHRDRWQEARQFFVQLAEALRALPKLGVVLAMREDHVAEIDPYAALLPRRLKARYRMERLGTAGAIEAVKQPALKAGVPFAEGVAEKLVDDLRRIRVARSELADVSSDQSILGPDVEPVQLQVVCNQLWLNLPDTDTSIEWSDIEKYGNINKALTSFYEACLLQVRQKLSVPDKEVREWFSHKLITPMQTRGLVLRGNDLTDGLSNSAVDELETLHIIHADLRAGARWYELAHDRLIDPVLQSNQRWEFSRQTPLLLAARRWRDSDHDVSSLYRGKVLADAAKSMLTDTAKSVLGDVAKAIETQRAALPASLHDADIELQVEFIKASYADERRRNRARRVRLAVAIGLMLGIVAMTVLAIIAFRSADIANQASIAEHQRALVKSAERVQYINQEESLLLLREALTLGHSTDAEGVLRQAVIDYYPARTLANVNDVVYDVAYSPDGQSIAAGLATGQVQVWNVASQQPITVSVISAVNGSGDETSSIWHVAYSPDSQWLAMAGGDSQVYVWHLTDRSVLTLTGHTGPVYSVAFSPDGRWLASGSKDQSVRLWSTQSWQSISLTAQTDASRSVAFSPDGKFIASGSWDRSIAVWPIVLGTSGGIAIHQPFTLTGHTAAINSIAISPDGRYLASGADDKTVRVWSLATQREAYTFVGHTDPVRSVSFSTDGHFLLSGSNDATVLIWDTARFNKTYIGYLTGPNSVVNAAVFSPDGRYVVAGSGDQAVHIWDTRPAANEKYSTLTGHSGTVRSLTYSGDGQLLVSASSDRTIRVWSTDNGTPKFIIPKIDSDVWAAAISLDGRWIASAAKDGKTRIYDLASTNPLTPVVILGEHTQDVDAVAFSPDGKYLATGSWDKTAIIWDTTTWQPLHKLEGHTDYVHVVLFSRDSKWLATGSDDKNTRVWDVQSGNLIKELNGHTSSVYGLAFSPDGKNLATSSWDKTIRIWDLKTFDTIDILAGHDSFVYSIDYSPDGQTLFSGSWDQTVRLWDVSAVPARALAILYAHTALVRAVAFSPDGHTLASGSADTTIRRYPAKFPDVLNLARQLAPRELTPLEHQALMGEGQ
jgi:WD40 repeat protein